MLKSWIFLFLVLGGSLAAQPIPIDSSDMPLVGQVFVRSIADTLPEVLPGPGGENQLWDFSSLEAVDQQISEFVNPASLPFGLTFGDASVALRLPAGDTLLGFQLRDAHQFYRLTDSTWEDIGTGAELDLLTTPLSLRKDTADIVYRFPLSYGDRDTSYSSATFTIPFINLFYNTRQTRYTEVDGWGEVSTPFATYTSLRVAATIVRSDTISFGETQQRIALPRLTAYNWLAKGQILPVLTINRLVQGDTLTYTGTVSYQDTLRSTFIPPQIIEPLSLYPNPAKTYFQIEWERQLGTATQVAIYTLAGKRVGQWESVPASPVIFIQHLPPGIYSVRVRSKEGIHTGRLIIQP